jgi:hypothetical protein
MSRTILRRAAPEVARCLAACVRDPADPSLPGAIQALVERGELGALLGLANRHRVLGALAAPLRRAPGVPREELAAVEARLARQGARHLRVLADLRGAAGALEGIPWFAAKGPVLAETVYPSPELRAYGDLDLVVPAGAFERAVRALEAMGAVIEDRNWALLRRDRRGQLHVRLPLGTLADVHWHLVNRGAVRDQFRVGMEELFARVGWADLAGLRIPVLEPTDALLHLALHASLSGCNRLVWLQDIAAMLRRGGVSLEDLVRRARAWRVSAQVAIALDHAARVLGAPVPPETLRDLYGSRARAAVSRRLGALWPPERSIGQDPAALWAQLVRETWPATALAISRRARRATQGSEGPVDGHAALRAAGGPEDRDAFFAAVGREMTPPIPRQ